jgi:Fe-S-cluster containining protein
VPVSAPEPLWEQIARCRNSSAFTSALTELYAELDGLLSSLSVHCKACGDCCNFATSGMRLYASTGELGMLSASIPPNPRAPEEDRCPYQVDGKCRARQYRPLGCRTFFCEKEMQPVLATEYERLHDAIRILHQTHCLPYAYVDLVAAFLQLLSIE